MGSSHDYGSFSGGALDPKPMMFQPHLSSILFGDTMVRSVNNTMVPNTE